MIDKNIFGKPGDGVHSDRIGPYALWDVVGMVVISYAVSKYFKCKFWICLLVLFIIAEISHIVVGVDTAFVLQMRSLL